MKQNLIILLVMVTSVMILAACRKESDGTEASKVAEAYLMALVNKDSTSLSTFSCKDWEAQASMELDSFQAVKTELQDLSCTKTGTEGDMDVVTCTGKINATYNNENMQIDLSKRPFLMKQQGGEWQVCGYK